MRFSVGADERLGHRQLVDDPVTLVPADYDLDLGTIVPGGDHEAVVFGMDPVVFLVREQEASIA